MRRSRGDGSAAVETDQTARLACSCRSSLAAYSA